MQIKPFFEEYEEISRIPVIKDDRGVQYSLVHFKALVVDKPYTSLHYQDITKKVQDETEERNNFRLPEGYTVKRYYEGYVVMSDKLDKYSNGATAFDEVLYWKEPKKLQVFNFGKVQLVEVFCGQNSYFHGELPTMNTKFWVINTPDEKNPI